jgi:hypothetical protein
VHVEVGALGHAGQESGEFQRALFRRVEGTHGALFPWSCG